MFQERLLDPKCENSSVKNSVKGFYSSDPLPKVLDLWRDSADAHEKILAWSKPKAIALVHELVEEEANGLSAQFLMQTEDTTPEFRLNFSIDYVTTSEPKAATGAVPHVGRDHVVIVGNDNDELPFPQMSP
ncbi:hypothetical protein DENSPDRAFT_885331 [Dentipellis sp. KUC8613]|nr:hypothetical protein DENSPDRAFT_885331 [Dentipellis sp. KUC8613]